MVSMSAGEILATLGFKYDQKSAARAAGQAKKLSSDIKRMLRFVGITISAAGLISFGKQAVNIAAQIEQTKKRINAVFDEFDENGYRISENASEYVENWVKNTASAVKRSQEDLRNYVLSQGEVLKSLEMTSEEAASLGTQMVETAINIGAFLGMQDAEAVSKMTSAVQGSAEAARQLNVDLSDTKLQETMVAMGYHGVYEALDDASKATVRYNAIVAQSQGALEGVGAAAKALEDNDFAGWQNAWNASLNNFKAVMGSYILPYVTEAYKLGTKIVETLTRSIDRQGKVNTHAERAARIFGAINRVLSVVYNAGKKVVDFIGGADNAVQLLMVTLGTLMGLKLVDYIGKIGTALAGVNIWVVLLVAVALGLFIVIQDFYNFMNGKDSVLGRFFEMKGIDPDKVRQKISDFVDKTKEKIEEFKKKAGEFKDALAGMFRQKGEELKDEYGPRLEKMLDTVGPIVEQFETLGNNLKELGENAWPYIEPFLNGLLAFFDTLAKIDLEIEFSKIEGTVKALEPLLAMFNSLIEAANLALKGDSEGADKKLEEAWGHLVEVGEVISKQIFETISNILGLLPDEALKWGSGMIENLRKGIDSGIDKLRAKVLEVLDALGPIGTAIKWLAGVDEEDAQGAGSTLHVDAAGVERGGSNGKAGARKPKSGWATRRTMEDIQKLAGSSSPAVDTVNNFDRSGNTLNSSPTFNSTINNTFYSTDQQTISNGMQATNNVAREWDDYTRQLSREATAVGW